MFQCSQQIGVVCSRELYCVGSVSIGKHRKVYCEVFCIRGMWIAQRIRYLIMNNDVPKVVAIFVLALLFFFGGQKFFFVFRILSEITTFRKSSLFLALLFFSGEQEIFFCLALLVSIDHSHSTLRHRPRKSSTCAALLRARRLLLRRLGSLVIIGVHTSEGIARCRASC